jgi:phosphatidylethanolamine/phosphatidyl-N-methylethanolamine N-methyltransferase
LQRAGPNRKDGRRATDDFPRQSKTRRAMTLLETRGLRDLDGLKFFLSWLRRPARVGAVVPSGEALATALAGQIDVAAPGTVIELGAGTGRVTKALLEAGVASQGLVAIEREASFCAMLAARFPEVRIVQGDARALEPLVAQAGIEQVKAVVSSLPLLSLSSEVRRTVLSQAFATLAPNGVLVQYTYGPASPVPPELSAELRIEGERTGWVLANLPPAAVWRYRRARAAPGLPRAA